MLKRDLYMDKYYLKDFLVHLESEQKSERTIENYSDNIILFIEYFIKTEEQEFDPLCITKIDIIDYIRYLQKEKKLHPSSINLRIQSLKSYFNYLVFSEICKTDPTSNIRNLREIRIHEVKSFDESTFRAIRRLIYRTGNPLHIAIWEVLTRAGLGVNELCNLTFDNLVMNLDIDDIRVGKLIIYGKGNIFREIPLHKDCREALVNWIKIRKYKHIDLPYIFTSQRGKFTRSGINRILKKYYNIVCKEENYTVHSCRHYFCRSLILKGVDLPTVAKLAGHTNAVITSEIYTVPNQKDMINAVNKL